MKVFDPIVRLDFKLGSSTIKSYFAKDIENPVLMETGFSQSFDQGAMVEISLTVHDSSFPAVQGGKYTLEFTKKSGSKIVLTPNTYLVSLWEKEQSGTGDKWNIQIKYSRDRFGVVVANSAILLDGIAFPAELIKQRQIYPFDHSYRSEITGKRFKFQRIGYYREYTVRIYPYRTVSTYGYDYELQKKLEKSSVAVILGNKIYQEDGINPMPRTMVCVNSEFEIGEDGAIEAVFEDRELETITQPSFSLSTTTGGFTVFSSNLDYRLVVYFGTQKVYDAKEKGDAILSLNSIPELPPQTQYDLVVIVIYGNYQRIWDIVVVSDAF